MATPTHPNQPIVKTGLLCFLFITILIGVATQATATPYTLRIENPGVWSITGNFDSNSDTWTLPTDIMNWEFTADVIATPSFTVGPLVEGIDSLFIFRGSTASGISDLGVQGDGTLIQFGLNPDGIRYSVAFSEGPPGLNKFSETAPISGISNNASAVPEPTTALLLLTGLAGLAVWRWRRTPTV